VVYEYTRITGITVSPGTCKYEAFSNYGSVGTQTGTTNWQLRFPVGYSPCTTAEHNEIIRLSINSTDSLLIIQDTCLVRSSSFNIYSYSNLARLMYRDYIASAALLLQQQLLYKGLLNPASCTNHQALYLPDSWTVTGLNTTMAVVKTFQQLPQRNVSRLLLKLNLQLP
jgi:hypothetical protein